MENSFFEFRDKTEVESDYDSEVIDGSVEDITTSTKKKNQTAYVAESEDSDSYDESEEEAEVSKKSPKSSIRLSSENDSSRRGSIKQHINSSTKIVVSSSDDEAYSPEMIPKKRLPSRQSQDSNESIIIKRNKKRLMLIDSDTDNSIIIEHNKNKKQACIKSTPLKSKDIHKSMELESEEEIDSTSYDENKTHCEDTTVGSNYDESIDSDNADDNNPTHNITNSNDKTNNNSIDDLTSTGNKDIDHQIDDEVSDTGVDENNKIDKSKQLEVSLRYGNSTGNCDSNGDETDDGPDEDLMAVSRATRMSIMGIIPKVNDSDDSDYIQSDESSRKSKDSVPDLGVAEEELDDLPEVTISKTPTKDNSRLTCSPFTSPLHDITNIDDSFQNDSNANKNAEEPVVIDLCDMPPLVLNSSFDKRNSNIHRRKTLGKENDDDDITIIESKPEVIALSSDDEDFDYIKAESKKSPRPKKSPAKEEIKPKKEQSIKQYLVPESYPNQVVYVKKQVRENELSKLNRIKEDLDNVKYLLEHLDLESLPDEGANLIQKLTHLEEEFRKQGDKVANMVVTEEDEPSALKMDSTDKGLSWDDIQKASNAVQPRMFGKQAMATHMAERNMILERLRSLHASLASRPSESALATPPRALVSTLMPHQRHALAWLQWRETQQPRAGILADDMGLGKTITMIALMASDKEMKIDHDVDDDDDEEPRAKTKLVAGGTLVVCPASLLQQWGAEVRKHCSAHALSVVLHHGASRATQPHRLATYDMVATTYNILQRESESTGVLMRVRWRRVILDEAHIVRNHKAATSRGVCALRASRRWALTGTPVHNKDIDLFALLKFLRCSPFDDLAMWKKWIDNKSTGGQERLNTVMSSLLLRRTKMQLQQKGELKCLPEKKSHMLLVPLTQQEMNVYQKVLVLSKSLFAQFLHQRAEKNSGGSMTTGFSAKQADSEYYKMHKKMVALQGAKPVKSHEILVLLLRLRQVCCHCGLIASMLDEDADHREDASDDLLQELDKLSLNDSRSKRKSVKGLEDEEGVEEESATVTEAIRAVLSPNNPVFKLDRASSKIEAVMDCLKEKVFCNKGDKAVVVSQWTSVLRLVETQLAAMRVRSVTLSGVVPVKQRPKLIDDLNDPNSDVKVMLLSLCAGGVGINLCGANHLLLLDPHWNPQLEEQAQDRIYRVGQMKNVNIYRFVCVDTVEQTIRKLQEAKLQLAENVLTGARNNAASALSIEDLKMLFNMGQ